jgi:superfamily I DNA/RNA helicase
VPSPKVKKAEKLELRANIFARICALWRPVIDATAPSLWDALLKSTSDSAILRSAREVFTQLLELSKGEDISEFAAVAARTLAPWRTPADLLAEMRAWVSFYEQHSAHGSGASVRIMTVQSSKGLEAAVVCVIGVEEGLMPKGAEESDHLAEQARLFYVSATRAKHDLHLFYARKRSGHLVYRDIYNKGGPPDVRPSRFIEAIDAAHKKSTYHPA